MRSTALLRMILPMILTCHRFDKNQSYNYELNRFEFRAVCYSRTHIRSASKPVGPAPT